MHPQQHTPRLSGSEVEICTLPVGTQNKTGSGELGNLSQERCFNSLQSLQLSPSPWGESSVSELCLSACSARSLNCVVGAEKRNKEMPNFLPTFLEP